MKEEEELIENHIIETNKHIDKVKENVKEFSEALVLLVSCHDHTKLISPELDVFAEYTPKLKDMTYGSDKYNQCLKEIGPALEHHYKNNSHHPEHFTNGIAGMTLFDLVEMFCDWKAATQRHADGDMGKSLEINGRRFVIPPQLQMIFKNTAIYLGW